jgi:hypothetical protein
MEGSEKTGSRVVQDPMLRLRSDSTIVTRLR